MTGGAISDGITNPAGAAGESDLLPFDFATVLLTINGDAGMDSDPESGADWATQPAEADYPSSSEEGDAAAWRPGSGWLPVAGLHAIPVPETPVDWDRTLGFSETTDDASDPSLQSETVASGASERSAGAAARDLPTSAFPTPLAFQLKVAEIGAAPATASPIEIAMPVGSALSEPEHLMPEQSAERAAGLAPAPSSPAEPGSDPEPFLESTPVETIEASEGADQGKAHPASPQSRRAAGDREPAHDGGSTGSGPEGGPDQRAQPPAAAPVRAHSWQPGTPASSSPSTQTPHPSTQPAAIGSVTAPPPAPGSPVNSVHIRLDHTDTPRSVDVHVRERGGEVHVAVRGADISLNQELRQDLPSLLQRLEQQGFRGEAIGGLDRESLRGVGAQEQSSEANSHERPRDDEPQHGRKEEQREPNPDRDSSRERRQQRWWNEWMEITD